MQTPAAPVFERERERERVASSPSFPRRHKILFGIIVIVGILLYAAFNVWVWRYSKSGKVLKDDSPPWRGVTFTGIGSKPAVTPTPPAKQDPAPRDTPRPTGPGKFACSPEGDCNVYSDAARTQYCTTTYADSLCLDQCGRKEVQCKQ